MVQIYKKIGITVLIFMQFCDVLQAAQGAFQKNIFEKPFKISLLSKNFLQNIVKFQQDFLTQRQACQLPDAQCVRVVQSMLQWNLELLQTQEISKKLQSDLFSMVHLVRQTLFEQESVMFCDLKDQAFKSWWNFLERSLDHVQVQGHKSDFVWLCTQAAQLIYAYQLNLDVSLLKIKTIQVVTACQDLMSKFNGLLINDYDLLVLGNVAVALVAMKC